MISSPISSPISGPQRAILGQGAGGAAAPRIAFVADPYVQDLDDNAVDLNVTGATPGAAWEVTISSSGGGTDVTDSGTVASASFSIANLDLTGLGAGTLTASYTEDAVEVATDTAVLGAYVPKLDFSDPRNSMYLGSI